MLDMGNIAAQAAKEAGPIAKKALEKVVITFAGECAKKLAGRTAKPKMDPKKPIYDGLANSVVQDTEKLVFRCLTEIAVGNIRNHLAKQARQS